MSELLVERARSGDTAAYGELVQKFRPAIFAIAFRRCRNHADSEEITQNVILHGMKKISQLKDPAAFRGWLRIMVSRFASNHMERKRNNPCEPGLFDFEDRYESPEVRHIPVDEIEKLVHTVSYLPEIDQEILRLHYFQSQSLIEIVAEKNIPIGTAKRRLHTARKRLRHLMLLA